MGRFVIISYKPLPGKEQRLLELTRKHLPILRSLGLAIGRDSYVMRATAGTILEVFEWKSAEAIAPHQSSVWAEMCERYGEACEYIRIEYLSESEENDRRVRAG